MNYLETRGPHQIGPWEVVQVVEWEGEAFPHTFLFPQISLEELREASPAGKDARISRKGMIISSTQFFVLKQSGLVILIEQGTGNDKTRPDEPYWDHQKLPYLETLASLGFGPEDVNYVLLSHLHPDHVGLATTFRDRQWVPTFPCARYVMHVDEWTYWKNLPDRPCFIQDSVVPLVDANMVEWAGAGDEIAGIRIHEAPGHTPGSLLFEIQDTNVWFIGDLLHHPSQVRRLEWPSGSFACDHALLCQQRQKYFSQFAAAGALLFSVHLGNSFRVEQDNTAGAYNIIFTSETRKSILVSDKGEYGYGTTNTSKERGSCQTGRVGLCR
ncbi:MAG: MBL fold metallo-hydrolase [Anaerolineales bacterium]|nr:MBL fold metallo-hydrolase [Anaerolineales bacterium]